MRVIARGCAGFAVVATAVAAVVSAPRAAAQQADAALLEQVRAAWGKRQDTVRSLRVTWATKTTIPRGSRSGLPRRPGSTAPDVMPARDAVHDGAGELLLDGEKARISMRGTTLNDNGEFIPREVVSVFDGKQHTRLRGQGPGGVPAASIKAASQNDDGGDMVIAPMLRAVRGLVPAVARIDLERFTQTRRVVVGNRPLVELTRPRDETRGEEKLWVDPAQDFLPVRNETYDREGGLTFKMTAQNSVVPGASACWLPEKWTCALWVPAGKLIAQDEVTAQTRATNVGTTPGDFQLSLPARTWLLEEGDNNKLTESVIREDGTKRLVLPSEASKPYEELLRTDTPGTGSPRSWWWIALGLVIALGSLVLLFRRRLFPRTEGPASTP